jgi:tetratricopeptide (TPR) repeat protein
MAQPRQDPADASRPLWTVWSVVLLLAFALLAWWHSFEGALILDDFPWIVENRSIQPPTDLKEILLNPRPLLNLTLAANYAVCGPAIFDYHVVNLAIHLLAALALFGVLRHTLRRPQLPAALAARADPLALLCALLWFVHPLQTQAVTYIVQRSESMMGLLLLLTLYGSLRAFESGRTAWRVAAVAACVLGMLAKPTMVVAPLIILLYDRCFHAGAFREALRVRWPFHAALWATCAIPFALAFAFPDAERSASLANPLFTPLQYALTQPGVLLHYLRLVLWPSELCLAHDWPIARTTASVLIPGLIIVALLALTAWALLRRPALGFLGAFFFLILAPTSSILPIADACAEHRMYLPLAAVITLLLAALWLLLDRCLRGAPPAPAPSPVPGPRSAVLLRLSALLLILLAVAGLTLRTRARNAEYQSESALWLSALRSYPRSVFIRNNLSAACLRVDDSAAAERFLREALFIDPRSPITHYNLGTLCAVQGRLDEASAHFRAALDNCPSLWLADLNLGVACDQIGQFEQANTHYRAALLKMPPRAPQFAATLTWIAANSARLGRPAEAAADLRRALALRETPYALNHLAWLTATATDPALRNPGEAVRLAARARDLTGGSDVPTLRTLARALAEAGRFPDALRATEDALALATPTGNARLLSEMGSERAAYAAGRLPPATPLNAPSRSPAPAPPGSARPADSK